MLLGAMGSVDAVWEALSLNSFVKLPFWYAHGGVTEFNVGINWSTVLFLSGMMVMVEGMSEAGFFDWICLRLAKLLKFRPMPLMLSFMVLAALLSMLNSCASGVSVVNIDNGFGAGYLAGMMNHMGGKQ